MNMPTESNDSPPRRPFEDHQQQVADLKTALLESDEKFRALTDSAPVGIFLNDAQGNAIYVNRKCADLVGVPAEEALNFDWIPCLHPDDRGRMVSEWEKAFENSTEFHLEYRWVHADGNIVWTLGEVIPILGVDGKATQFIGTLTDITDRKQAEEALRESEEKYRAVVESTADGIVFLDPARKMIACNKGFSRLFGYAEDEIKGESARLIHQSDEMFHQFGEKAYGSFEKTGTYQGEMYLKKKDGTLFPAETVTSAIEKHGSETGYVGIIRDISARRKKEEERLRNERDLRESQRIAHLGSWRLDLETNEVFWTEELYRMYGFDPTLPPPPYTEHMKLFTPESWSLLSTSLAETRDTGIPYELELEMVRNDGNKGWIWVRGEAITDSEGKTIGLWGAAQDITERKGMEETLRQSQEKYKHLFNEAQVALFRTNIDGTLMEINERYAKTVDYETVEECMANFHAGKAWSDRKARDKLIKKLHQDGSVNDYEAEIVRKDGTHIWINFSATIYPEQEYIEGSLIDITARKLAEEDREKLQAHLNKIQKMESIGNLAGGISHDFNNILFPIMGLSELLLEDLSPGSLEHENARQILKAAERGSDLVQQILAFSRQTDHKMMPIRIQNVLKEVLKLVRSTIPANIDIKHHIQMDCGLVNGDATQVHQIAMNLITNAYHAVESENGEIAVRLREVEIGPDESADEKFFPGRYALLSVSDTGSGIDPAIKDKIFEPYFTTKDQGKGTGLGLAVVYGIVKEHHGDIKVYSEFGKGTTFTLYLPIMAKAEKAVSTEGKEDYFTGHERILLVDDEEVIVKLEKQILERLGYHVTERYSSSDALRAFRKNPFAFDLVISDLSMPNMTGDQLTRKLIAIRPDIPIIICTGFSERLIQEKAAKIGVKGFLMKPAGKSEMAQTVRKVLDAAKAEVND